MDPRAAFALTITLLSAGWGVVTGIRMQEFLRRRGRKVNLLLMRWMLFSYANDYRRITKAELGRPGSLYPQFVYAWLIALASAIYAATILALAK